MDRHRFDPISFVFGTTFVLAGLPMLGGGTYGLPMEWAGPLVAVLLGLVILFAARPRPSPSEDPESQADET